MSDQTPLSDPGEVSDAGADETDRLISLDKVEGTSMYNPQGDKLGSIHTVMLDKYSGQVSYTVMSFGGFLGIGESYHPPPLEIPDLRSAAGRLRGECQPRAA